MTKNQKIKTLSILIGMVSCLGVLLHDHAADIPLSKYSATRGSRSVPALNPVRPLAGPAKPGFSRFADDDDSIAPALIDSFQSAITSVIIQSVQSLNPLKSA